MTTIAWDGEILAADSLTSADTSVVRYHNKIQRLKDGNYLACVGYIDDALAFRKWWNSGCKEDKPTLDETFTCYMVYPDGECVQFWNSCLDCRITGKEAIGSGDKWALAAMDFGKNAREAIKYAKTRDTVTGGRVNWVRIK
jgi:ATP-dependent protease HslVU (ClpYQ) peptidase subunit